MLSTKEKYLTKNQNLTSTCISEVINSNSIKMLQFYYPLVINKNKIHLTPKIKKMYFRTSRLNLTTIHPINYALLKNSHISIAFLLEKVNIDKSIMDEANEIKKTHKELDLVSLEKAHMNYLIVPPTKQIQINRKI